MWQVIATINTTGEQFMGRLLTLQEVESFLRSMSGDGSHTKGRCVSGAMFLTFRLRDLTMDFVNVPR